MSEEKQPSDDQPNTVGEDPQEDDQTGSTPADSVVELASQSQPDPPVEISISSLAAQQAAAAGADQL